MLMRALFSESAHLEPNTSSHVSHHCTLGQLDWTEGTRVSPSRLPVVLHPCPSSPPAATFGHRQWIGHFHATHASSGLTSLRGTQSHIVETMTHVLRPAGRIFHTSPPPNALACKRHFHHASAAHMSSSSSPQLRFPSLPQRPSPYSPLSPSP